MNYSSPTPDLDRIPVFPPPLGVEPNFINPENQKLKSTILHSVLLSFVTLAVILRLYARGWVKRYIWIDDYFIMLAWALRVNYSAWFLAAFEAGSGRHLWDLPVSLLVRNTKMAFIISLCYQPLTLAIKLSVLVCYYRIFQARGLPSKIPIWFGICSISAFYTILFFCALFYCTPVEKAYNPTIPGHCMSYTAFPWASGIFNVVSDFFILVIPLPFICNLNMKLSKKIRVISIFGLGLFTCLASIMRLVWTIQHISDFDQSYSFVKYNYWVVLEVDVGLICASAMAFPALFDYSNPRSLGSISRKFRDYLSTTSLGSGRSSRDHHASDAQNNWVPLEESSIQASIAFSKA